MGVVFIQGQVSIIDDATSWVGWARFPNVNLLRVCIGVCVCVSLCGVLCFGPSLSLRALLGVNFSNIQASLAWCQSAPQVFIIVCLIASLLVRRPEPRLSFPPHLDFGKPSPEFKHVSACRLISQEQAIICTLFLTQTPLMEIPMAGGPGGEGDSYDNLSTWRTGVFCWEGTGKDWTKCMQMISVKLCAKNKICVYSPKCILSCILSQSLVGLENPWDSSQGACCPNESSFSVVGRTSGGDCGSLFFPKPIKGPKMPSIMSSTSSK